jgi:hypothetical protein
MMARLVLVDPDGNECIIPTVAIEDEQGLRLLADDWMVRIADASLETLTVEQVKCALEFPATVTILLSDSRDLPDFEWLSPEMLQWFSHWRTEALAKQNGIKLAKAS